jgi:hypothetical protein
MRFRVAAHFHAASVNPGMSAKSFFSRRTRDAKMNAPGKASAIKHLPRRNRSRQAYEAKGENEGGSINGPCNLADGVLSRGVRGLWRLVRPESSKPAGNPGKAQQKKRASRREKPERRLQQQSASG